MTGQPDQQHGRDDAQTTPQEPLSEEGAGLGMSEEGTTFEPEETPEAVDDPEDDGPDGPEDAGSTGA